MSPTGKSDKVLLTGGAGFIGSHIAERYLKAGIPVVIVDNLSSGFRHNLPPGVPFYKADICRKEVLETIFRKEKPTVINHHAAQIDLRVSIADPVQDARVNILGTVHLLEMAEKYRVRQFIFASSGGALYGECPKTADEKSPSLPMNPYAISKCAAENYIRYYGEKFSLHYVLLRYSNVYGPRQLPRAEGGVVALFAKALLKRKPVGIFGTGRQTRDFVYVGDVAEANRLAVGKKGKWVLNISSGTETEVLALHALFQKIGGKSPAARRKPPRPGEVRRSVLSPRQARKRLGWKTTVPLEEGLKRTLEWHRLNA